MCVIMPEAVTKVQCAHDGDDVAQDSDDLMKLVWMCVCMHVCTCI